MSPLRAATLGALAWFALPALVFAAQPKGFQHVAAGASGPPSDILGMRALVVGVSDFAHLPASDRLPNSAGDASWFAQALRQIAAPLEVVSLVGAQATTQTMRQDVQSVLARTSDHEIALLYFSTRGALVDANGYLLAADSGPDGHVQDTALPIKEIAAAVAQSKAEQVFLLVDAVGSQAAGTSGIAAQLGAIAAARPGVFVLPAEQVSPKDGSCPGHGLFTCALVDALEGGADANGDQMVTLGEVSRALPALLRAQAGGKIQTASYGQFEADLGLPVAATSRDHKVAPMTPPPDQIDVCFAANGKPVSSQHVFHTRDVLSLAVTTPQGGYMYVVNIGPDGAENVLFPINGEKNQVSPGTTTPIMPADSSDPIVLSDPPGPERMFIVWSAAPIAEREQVLALAKARVGGTADVAAWQGVTHTKGLMRLSQIDDVGVDQCTTLTPVGEEGAWVAEFTLNHG